MNFFESFLKNKKIPQKPILERTEEKKGGILENKEGLKPIRACLIDSKQIDSLTKKTIDSIEKNGQFVNWDGDSNFLEENNLKNAGESTYVISESNEKDKYSKRYYNCTGIIVIGEEKNSNKQISFLTHQDPWKFLSSSKKEFTNDLVREIKEIKNKIKENSVDITIFGGKKRNGDEYVRSVKFLSNILKEEFNFEPTIMTGPNVEPHEGPTNIYLDTQNRRLYIVRPLQNSKANENYIPSELEEQSAKWD